MSLNTQDEQKFQLKPVTVSSTSSMETASSYHTDRTSLIRGPNVSAAPSLIRTPLVATNSTQYTSQGNSPTTAAAAAMPSSISLVHNPLRSPSTGIVIPSIASPNAVPEFLYQLTKMLTDNNRDIIEWSNGRIEVHNPHKLQSNVLNRYFRHSKFASFQRQLNYFGFRKLAGKGKMAPCSYVNDATTNELRSLLHIKRKTGNEPKSKTAEKKRADRMASTASKSMTGAAKSRVAGNQYGDSTTSYVNSGTAPQHSQQAIARVAVGKGIRHSFSLPQMKDSVPSVPISTPVLPASTAIQSVPVQSDLNALQTNYQTSLQQESATGPSAAPVQSRPAAVSESSISLAYVPGSLRRDDSLVDLAMIPIMDATVQSDQHQVAAGGMPFIDFPWDASIFQDEEVPKL